MSEIKNKVAESGLVNFDLSSLVPKGKRLGIDLKPFLFQELVLKEKDFREKVKGLELDSYKDAYVYIYNSAEAIVPLWAYFLIASQLSGVAKKVIYGDKDELELLIMHQALNDYDFSNLKDKRVLVKGCTDENIPENAYIELVEKLKPIVKSLMFGEACSNVPIFKN
ncbi:DUF2480 family protein [Riemerella anatipestifer]|uniref:DUF2480 family protein n=3 Tax=Riemerella anatipestifer TaxID=34085 RepID=J9R674_RIEAN|nr:DUF2480 family protein [Riemerella anatipestifer]ADQ81963.1 Protein of unknown function DUF2480 [Riemerella anatipestifer ATCC 11845 = DSM 15868]ADZ12539.1 hypothetical protein RIA_1450 [Riemerella anatipestifer RA-GD]AFD55968.1 hypothetical protein RA0C_1039 [Riemerella anatipestifer ATCC 11845 = DSM 15868]AFR35678.1 hypothetical protein B739_1079 [Riemerella anatipestifer RA-CH-1]AGC40127.1 hypothetical protein G148_0823 [Riemerella anatipestifer RA-CH-2]